MEASIQVISQFLLLCAPYGLPVTERGLEVTAL